MTNGMIISDPEEASAVMNNYINGEETLDPSVIIPLCNFVHETNEFRLNHSFQYFLFNIFEKRTIPDQDIVTLIDWLWATNIKKYSTPFAIEHIESFRKLANVLKEESNTEKNIVLDALIRNIKTYFSNPTINKWGNSNILSVMLGSIKGYNSVEPEIIEWLVLNFNARESTIVNVVATHKQTPKWVIDAYIRYCEIPRNSVNTDTFLTTLLGNTNLTSEQINRIYFLLKKMDQSKLILLLSQPNVPVEILINELFSNVYTEDIREAVQNHPNYIHWWVSRSGMSSEDADTFASLPKEWLQEMEIGKF